MASNDGFEDYEKFEDLMLKEAGSSQSLSGAAQFAPVQQGFTGGKDPILDRAVEQVDEGITTQTRNIYGMDLPERAPDGVHFTRSNPQLDALCEIEAYLKDPSAGILDISYDAKFLAPRELGEIAVDRDPRNIGVVGDVTPRIAEKALEGIGKHSMSPNEVEAICEKIPSSVLQDPKIAEKAIEKAGAQALPSLAKVDAPLAEKSLDLAAKMGLPEKDRLKIIDSMPALVLKHPNVFGKALDCVDPRKIVRDTRHGTNENTLIKIANASPIALTITLRTFEETMDRKGASHEQKQAVFNTKFGDLKDESSGIPALTKIAMDCVKENPASYPSLIKRSDVLKANVDLANEAVKGSFKNLPSVDPGVRKRLPPMTIEKAMMGAVQNQNPAFADDQRRALRVGIVAKGFDTQKPAFQEALSSNPSLKPMVEAFADERKQLKAGLAAKAAQAPSQAPSQTEAPARKMESTGRFSSPPKIDRQDEEVKVQKRVLGMGGR